MLRIKVVENPLNGTECSKWIQLFAYKITITGTVNDIIAAFMSAEKLLVIEYYLRL